MLLKLNVSNEALDAVREDRPGHEDPHSLEVAQQRGLRHRNRCAEKRASNMLIPALKDAGATDILELPIEKIIH